MSSYYSVCAHKCSSSKQPPWYAGDIKDYTELSEEHLPSGYVYGCKYTSVSIDVPVYLEYLHSTCIAKGVKTIHASLPVTSSFEETLLAVKDFVKKHFSGTTRENVAAFVNATGISAKTLVPDEAVFPIRGQTVVVKGVSQRITTAHFPTDHLAPTDPSVMYIIPRGTSGTTVLGGTQQKGNWKSTDDSGTSQKILENAKQFAPELLNENGEFEVLHVKVGLRPGRAGGARLEVEQIGDILVCHAYGNAGGGK
jgi:D-amino-acid oxidase